MMKFIVFCFSTLVSLTFLSGGVYAQCGPAGLDPCMVAKAAGAAVKTVVNKASTAKKTVVRNVPKTTAKARPAKPAKPAKPTRSDADSTSIYDSLSLKPLAKPAPKKGDLFPLEGVTLGKTTERQLQLLGGERNVFVDQSTGENRVYYTIENLNYWVRDGVADSVGIYKFMDKFPARWQILGFDYDLSYNQAIERLESLGYTVERIPDLPKFEDIGKVSRLPRIIGTKQGTVPVRVVMSFLIEKDKGYDSPDTLLYMLAGVKH